MTFAQDPQVALVDSLRELNHDEVKEWMFLQRQRGNGLFKQKVYQEALEVYHLALLPLRERLMEMSEELKTESYCPIMLNMATCHYSLGSFKEALFYTNKVVEERGSHSETHLKRGCILARMGRENEAKEAFQLASLHTTDANLLATIEAQLLKLHSLPLQTEQTTLLPNHTHIPNQPQEQALLVFKESGIFKRMCKNVKDLCSRLRIRPRVDRLLSHLILFGDSDD